MIALIVFILPFLLACYIAYRNRSEPQVADAFKGGLGNQKTAFLISLYKLLPFLGFMIGGLLILLCGVLGYPLTGRSNMLYYMSFGESVIWAIVINLAIHIRQFLKS